MILGSESSQRQQMQQPLSNICRPAAVVARYMFSFCSHVKGLLSNKALLSGICPFGSSRSDRTEDVEFRGSALSLGGVQGHRGANESLQCLLVDRIALVEIDGAPCVPLETGIEEPRRVPQSRPFGEGHLDDVLVSLAGADQPGVRPHRNT